MTTRKLLFAVALICCAILRTWADEPFRNHRYDSFRATPVTEQSIVFVGNSITNMQPWAELFTAPNVVNRGNSGGFSWEVLENIQSFIAKRPAKLFLMIGTNDMNVTGYAPENVVANVRQTVKHIQKESPKTQIFIESVMASNNGSRTVDKVRTLNAQLKAMTEEVGVTYVDYFDATLNIANGGGMSYDNLHPHVLGTYAWTNAVASYVGEGVKAVLPENPTINNGGQSNSYGARASVFGQLPVTADDVLFIGDEFVHSGEWQELLGNPNVKNRGTGWGKWGPNISFQTACVPFILQGLEGNVAPKQVVLMIGTQNLTSASSDKEAFKTNYEACIAAIREKAPTAKITLVSEIPYNVTSLNASNLAPINQWLKEKADADANMDYCDLFSLMVNESYEANNKYLNTEQYVTGLGYQLCARELAKHIDGCTVMGEEEAEAYYALVGARKALSNQIDVAELSGAKINVEPYYELLANNATTVAELETAIATFNAELHAALTPVPGKWYTMTAKRNSTVFFTKAAAGNGFIASASIDEGGNSYWQLQAREDNTYDICNGAGYYAVPTATHNVQLNLSKTQPDAGWSLDNSAATGAFNVTAKVGSAEVNCCMNLTGQNTIFNWVTNRTTDQGCQVVFAEVDFDPSTLPEITTTVAAPCKLIQVDGDTFTGEQWWYNIKIKDTHYLYDHGTAEYMSLDRVILQGIAEEEWAVAGNDQEGYTIYNHLHGTAKVLASPATIAQDNGSAYPILVDAANVPAGYDTKWMFAPSADIEGSFYMYPLDKPTYKVNNYGAKGKLSYWVGGADKGSSLLFEVAEATVPVTMNNGTLYRSGAVQLTGWVSQWKSTATEPFQYTLTAPANNIDAANCTDGTLKIAVGQVSGSVTFAVTGPDYYVHAYKFNVTAGNDNQTITPNGGAEVDIRTSAASAIAWETDGKTRLAASFKYLGANVDAVFTDIWVTVRPIMVEPEPQTNLFEYGTPGNNVCYRIPAIATASNGNVIAMTDYRYGGADIGFGRVSLRYRVSQDNGETWGDIKTLQESHQGQYGVDKADDLWAGFGDPALVADRESSRVMALSCCGNVSYPAGTWEHHQGIARFYSNDNGETWETFGDPVDGIECHWQDIAPTIYQQFKDGGVQPAAMFVGSGRIFQSRFTKVGQYYRIYCVVLLRTAAQSGLNYVIYSDDFGATWNILGGDNITAGVTGGDEPKAEELPDGSVLLSSRATGRIFNIFHFTDVEKGEGSWMAQAASNASNNGTVAEGNACNGEIMILPVIRKADEKKMWLALQSVPFGPGGRYNVGIYYKGLDNYEKFSTPANFAKNWEGRHQASYMSSAYSTMTLQHDGNIGFMYEEDTFGKSYTQVYKRYSIEQITDTLYTLDTDPVNPFVTTSDGIEAVTSTLTYSNYVGGLLPEAETVIDDALTVFKNDPSQENYIAIFSTIASAPRVVFDPKVRYIVRNCSRGGAGAYAMCVDSNAKLMNKPYDPADGYQQWSFIPTENEDCYLIYNSETTSYIPNLPGTEIDILNVKEEASAGEFRLQNMGGDHIAMINLYPTNQDAIHAPGAYTTRMVCWNAQGEASQWFFEATEIPAGDYTAVETPEAAQRKAALQVYDLAGRRLAAPRQKGIYITGRRKVVKK